MEEVNNLFIIMVWSLEPNAGSGCYAVIAKDKEEAEKSAHRMHQEETELPDELIRVDSELSFEVTCAADMAGRMYDIRIIEQQGSTNREF